MNIKAIEDKEKFIEKQEQYIKRISEPKLTEILKAFKTRLEYDLFGLELSTQNVYAIHRLDDSYKEMLISQLKAGKTPPNLVSYVSSLQKLPDDVKKQVLKVDHPISAEEGEIVAKFKTPEERKEIMNEIKYLKKQGDECAITVSNLVIENKTLKEENKVLKAENLKLGALVKLSEQMLEEKGGGEGE